MGFGQTFVQSHDLASFRVQNSGIMPHLLTRDSMRKRIVLALLPLVGCSWISPECKIARQELAEIKVNPPKYSGTDITDGTALIYAEVKVKKWCYGAG